MNFGRKLEFLGNSEKIEKNIAAFTNAAKTAPQNAIKSELLGFADQR